MKQYTIQTLLLGVFLFAASLVYSCDSKINGKDVSTKSFILGSNNLEIPMEQSEVVSLTLLPIGSYPGDVLLSSSDESIVKVTWVEGAGVDSEYPQIVIDALSEGEAVVEVSSKQKPELKETCKVVVGPKEILRRTLLYRFTATWCGYCPTMSAGVLYAQRLRPDEIIEIAFHTGDILTKSEGEELEEYFRISSLPSGVVNADPSHILSYTSNIASAVDASVENYPLASVVELEASINEAGLITAEVDTQILEDGRYRLMLAVTIDGYMYPQTSGGGSSLAPDYEQQNVFNTFITEGGVNGEDLGDLVQGDSFIKEYSFDFSEGIKKLPVNYDLSYNVVAYIQKLEGGKYIINNADIVNL